LKVGQIVVADQLLAADAEPVQIDLRMPADPSRGLHVGAVLTCDQIVRTVAEKQTLAAQSGAICVDMESHAVAALCRDLRRRCLAIRVITDDATHDLPPEVLSVFGSTGAVRFGAVVGALWKRPSSYQDLWRLREAAQSASKHLADFLDGVVHQLQRSAASVPRGES
jgi:adenosylhomocysteine nucleosidase